jgi:hypothetical protein
VAFFVTRMPDRSHAEVHSSLRYVVRSLPLHHLYRGMRSVCTSTFIS